MYKIEQYYSFRRTKKYCVTEFIFKNLNSITCRTFLIFILQGCLVAITFTNNQEFMRR